MMSPPRRVFFLFPLFLAIVGLFYCYHRETGPQKVRRPELPIARDTISVLDNKTFIISPYYDSRVGDSVSVLSIIHQSVKEIYCLFHCSKNQTVSVRAEIDLHEWFGFPYGAADLLCGEPLSCDYRYLSFHSPGSTSATEKLLFEVKNHPPPTLTSNFTVCISTLYRHFNNALQMVQSIEMYKLLGASKITIYNTSCSQNVDKVLRYYIDEGTLEVVPWPIDQHLRTSIRWYFSEELTSQVGYYGQIATLNDCLYRNMYKSKYILLNDIDEIILPVKDQDWTSLMDRLQTQHPNTSVFLFESHLFTIPVNISEFDLWPHVPGINILFNHFKEPIDPNVNNPRKMIVNPREIFQTSIHFATKHKGKWKEIPSSLGITFHCNPKKMKNSTTDGLIRDDLLWRYNMSLVPSVDKVIQNLFPRP